MIKYEKRLNKGVWPEMARDKSKHVNCVIASIIPGIDQPFGSMVIANRAIPSESLLHKVAKTATSFNEWKSSRFLSCNVCKNEFNLENANFNEDFASREVMSKLLNNFLHESGDI